ncbi:MAG: hypothetical protein M0R75_15580 [Dehalococcoidia bacterium]|nr:hypothetical protein [Dehalococcoidia bacterium]
MTEKSYVWEVDGGGDESPHSVAEWCTVEAAIAGAAGANEGVLPRMLNELAPSTQSGATQIRIASGWAIVDGHPYHNDGNEDFTPVTPSTGTTGRRAVLRADWSAQTVRIVEISSADGTATIPSLTQTSGTTYDIPICQYTVTTGGAIGSFVDEREFAGQHGAWRYVSDVSLAEADKVSSIAVSLPAGTTMVRMTGSIMSDTASRTLWLRLNNNSSPAVYASQKTTSSGASPASARVSSQAQIVLGGTMNNTVHRGTSFEVTITKRAAASPARIQFRAGTDQSGAILDESGSGDWGNTSDLLTSVNLLLSSTGSIYGSLLVEAFVP